MINLFNKAEAIFGNTKSDSYPISSCDDNMKKVLATRKKIHDKSVQKIEFSRPIISRDSLGVIFPNTIAVVQGKKGVHKSRLSETLCVCLLHTNSSINQIGFTRELLKPAMLLYVDTERNQNDQLPWAMQQIRKKSGYPINQNPEHFDFISLVDISRNNRFETLKKYIELKQKEFPDFQFVIVLDVVTDCIENFNDPRESLKLIDLMNELINQNDVTFICVIHENPSGEKARGHLGTEIINKASQVIQIAFDGEAKDLIMLKFLHSRNTRQIDSVYLRYDDEVKGLVEANADLIKQTKIGKQEKAPLDKVEVWIKNSLVGEVSREVLLNDLKKHFNCGEKTIDDRLKTLLEDDFLDKSHKKGKVYYSLKINF
ncbi:MAG: hypothetical protein ACOVOQ_01330 [Flavobacterium sp.]